MPVVHVELGVVVREPGERRHANWSVDEDAVVVHQADHRVGVQAAKHRVERARVHAAAAMSDTRPSVHDWIALEWVVWLALAGCLEARLERLLVISLVAHA